MGGVYIGGAKCLPGSSGTRDVFAATIALRSRREAEAWVRAFPRLDVLFVPSFSGRDEAQSAALSGPQAIGGAPYRQAQNCSRSGG